MIDRIFADFVHMLNVVGGSFFTPLFSFITFIGEKSWLFLIIALLLCLSKKTRWIGATIIFAIGFGWILADKIIKPIVGRERPYLSGDNVFYSYWKDTGAIEETDFSMPSGHTLGAAAFFISLCISCKKEVRKSIAIVGIVVTLLMIISRCYFMHHYLTDCLVGILFAFITSFIAKAVIKLLYKLFKSFENIPFFNFILNFDIADLFVKKND